MRFPAVYWLMTAACLIAWAASADVVAVTPLKPDPPGLAAAGLDRPARHQALIERAGGAGRVPVIVRLDIDLAPDAAPRSRAGRQQRQRLQDIQTRVLERLSVVSSRQQAQHAVKRFELTPALALQANRADLLALLADPEVIDVVADRAVPLLLDDSVALIGGDANGAFSADGGTSYTGFGQVVAVLDTGVDKNHPFLSGKVVSEACYSSNVEDQGATSLCPGGVSESTAEDSGLHCDAAISGCDHGTHVAGIAAGSSNEAGFSGVAREAGVIAIQVFSRFEGEDQCGSTEPCVKAFDSDIIKGLERVAQVHAEDNGISVAAANLSLGGGSYDSACDFYVTKEGETKERETKILIDTLRSAGIATVVASGNAGRTSSISSPACISSAVSVGSTTKTDAVSIFSNSADFLDLLAPGSAIQSAVLGDEYAQKSGTSMAAPHVAGAWAVLKEAAPGSSVDDLLQALQATGVWIQDERPGAVNRIAPRIQLDDALGVLGLQLPGQPATQSPSGAIYNHQPSYQWQARPAEESVSGYQLYIADGLSLGYTTAELSPAEVGCANTATCELAPDTDIAFENTAATWRVRARNQDGFGVWSAPARFWVVTALENGVPVTDVAGPTGSERFYSIEVPAEATNLEASISGGTGDADLYVYSASSPDESCQSTNPGNADDCTISGLSGAVYYITVLAYEAYSGLTLEVRWNDILFHDRFEAEGD
ncbi:MAG: S8 family serine peptidase [Wenzhouxiangella sp.]